ncbi:MAG TPA: Rieske 2Fe-2S domain-containing protein [Acidimicrobiia bacterium]|nr:Rieske 2Fe-2S domain-containing protein [Acidimicrobiia bacterium]
MRITFLGHVGFWVDTAGGSVLCDPWFTPAYFGSWFPFPRNDGLDPHAFSRPDYLYISHAHRDHFDPEWLQAHVDKGARVLLPDFGSSFLEQELRGIGFERFVHTRDGEAFDLDGLQAWIFSFSTPADGPLGDSLIVLDDGSARFVNQNDARPGQPERLQALGPFDAQAVQFSGAIWYPVAYDFPSDRKAALAREKRTNQMARARQYVEWIDAAHVFPCAGPPAFLDDALFGLNDFDRDPANIFPDQTVFLDVLEQAGITTGELLLPGSTVDLTRDEYVVTHALDDAARKAPFVDKRAYVEHYRDDWTPWLTAERASWSTSSDDVVGALAAWFEPLLERAPITSAGIAGLVVLDVGDPNHNVAIDFVDSKVRRWHGEPFVYKLDVDRRLIATLVERHTDDWVNSLMLSCRFVAHRPDSDNFNEYVMTFFKALSPERMAYVERSYRERRRHADEFFERDGWRIERWCPHRQADLTRFGEIDDGVLTCSLHHWQFDLRDGRCLTSTDRRLRCEPIEEPQ